MVAPTPKPPTVSAVTEYSEEYDRSLSHREIMSVTENQTQRVNHGWVAGNQTTSNATGSSETSFIDRYLSEAVLDAIHGKRLSDISEMFQKGQIHDPEYVAPTHPWRESPVTSALILLLHVLFVYHSNKRRSLKQVTTNYHRTIRRKRFYELWLAALSHPPVPATFGFHMTTPPWDRHTHQSASLLPTHSHHTNPEPCYSNMGRKLTSAVRALGRVCFGPLAGFLLLFCNAQILWSVRALEGLLHQRQGPWAYARMLLALSSCSLLFEIGVYHMLLRRARRLSRQAGFQSTPLALDRQLSQHCLGTCTAVTSALMLVFRREFQGVDWFLRPWTWVVLMCLAHTAQCGMMSVHSGVWIGLLWSKGLLSFLGEAYWGNWWLAWLGIATILSYKASDRNSLPIIDFVAWNRNGCVVTADTLQLVVLGDEERLVDRQVSELDDEAEDSEEEQDNHRDGQRLQADRLGRSVSDGVYGRIPDLHGMESDEGEDDSDESTGFFVPPTRRISI